VEHDIKALEQGVLELIRRTATDLPKDVEDALKAARNREKKASPAFGALSTILENVDMARTRSTPICQDTGTNVYHIWYGPNWWPPHIEAAIRKATKTASKKGYLRLNVVDSISGSNTGNNLGLRNPQMHFHPWNKKSLQIKLLLKGGGSENVSTQYSLPNAALGAGRDLDGIRRSVLDAVLKAQGRGCAPGVIGIGIGGDRGSSYDEAKMQLLRPLGDRSTLPQLAKLEETLYQELNSLGIGPMGFGGKTTVLGVLAGYAHRIPACFFVSVAYNCWASRRRTLLFSNERVTSIA